MSRLKFSMQLQTSLENLIPPQSSADSLYHTAARMSIVNHQLLRIKLYWHIFYVCITLYQKAIAFMTES